MVAFVAAVVTSVVASVATVVDLVLERSRLMALMWVHSDVLM